MVTENNQVNDISYCTSYTWKVPKVCDMKKWLEFINFMNNAIRTDK